MLEKRKNYTKEQFEELDNEQRMAALERIDYDKNHSERSFGAKEFKRKKKAEKLANKIRNLNRGK